MQVNMVRITCVNTKELFKYWKAICRYLHYSLMAFHYIIREMKKSLFIKHVKKIYVKIP